MKKWFLLVSLITLSLHIHAVPYVSPVNFMEILPCDEVMNIDGNDTEGCWGPAQSFTLFNSTGWTSAADFSGYFKLCWDQNYLYFYADITDDYNHSYDDAYADSWMFDNIEFFIDLDTANASTAYDDNTVQLRFNRGYTYPTTSGRASAGDFLYSYKEKSGGDGWIVEVGIPWTCALPSGSLPEDINAYVDNAMGLDVNFADSDNSDGDYTVGNRDAHGAWDMDGADGTEDLAWNNTKVFGIVELLTQSYPPAIPYTAPVSTLQVPAREVPIIFDGVDNEDSWSQPQDVTIFNSAGYSGDSDFDAYLRLTWDMDYLYFFANITDDVDHSYATGLADVWMFDNIELFLDLDTVMGTTDYDDNTIQLRFSRGLDQVETPGRAAATDFRYYWANTANGWVVEAGIPWTCAMPDGWLPEDFMYFVSNMLGFDANFADSDNSDGNADVGNRDTQAAWDTDGLTGDEDLAWNNTHVFGIIDLIGQPAGENPEPAGLPYEEPVRDMDIPARNNDLNLDGAAYETFWSYPQQLSVFNTSDYNGDEDFKGFFRTAWDQNYLYLYAEIKDDVDQSWSTGGGDPGNYDNLEVYVDLDTLSRETTYRDNSTTMIRFCRGNDEVQSTGRADASEFLYAWRNMSDGSGWQLEAAIPWTCALASGENISALEDHLPVIGFDVTANDLDASTPSGRALITQAAWDTDEGQSEDEALVNTRMFGIANLSPYGLSPVETLEGNELSIRPNPTNGMIRITADRIIARLQLYSLTGQLVMDKTGIEGENNLNISTLAAGTYLLNCTFTNGTRSAELIVKE